MKNLSLGKLMTMMVGFLILAVSLFLPEIAQAFGFGSGLLMAVTPVTSGKMTYQDINGQNDEYLSEDISQLVTAIEPMNYPFDTLTRKLGSAKPAHNIRVEFEEYGYHVRQDTITAKTLAGGGTSATFTPSNPAIWKVDDLAILPGVLVSYDGRQRELVVKVTANDGTVLTVVPVGWSDSNANSPTTVVIPDFSTSEPVTIAHMGQTKTELAANTDSRALLPVREWNYNEIIMETIENSKLFRKMKAKSGFNTIQNNILQSVKKFRSDCEAKSKWGVRYRGQKNGEDYYTMNGLTKYIDKVIAYPQGGLSDSAFVDWTREIFADNNGSMERHLLLDDMLMADILKVGNVQKQLQGRDVEVVRGIRTRRIETDFGTLYLSHDRSIAENGFRYYGIVVDPKNVRRRVLEPMEMKDLDLDTSGQRRVDAKRLMENFTIEVRHKDTHAIIRGVPGGGSGSGSGA